MTKQIIEGKRYILRCNKVTGKMKRANHGLYEATIDGHRSPEVWYANGKYLSDEHPLDVMDLVEQMPVGLELKHGSRYVLRNGLITNPLMNHVEGDGYRWSAEIGIGFPGTWTAEGKWRKNMKEPHCYDIVSEHVEVRESEALTEELSVDEVKAVRELLKPVKEPKNLTKERLLSFIRTHKRSELNMSFTFDSTPQGFDHWQKIYNGGELSVADYKYLASLL